MRRLTFVILFVLSGHAFPQNVNCPDGSPVDGQSRAGNASHCVVVRRIEPPAVSIQNVMIVFMHGDNGGTAELSTTDGPAFRLANEVGVPAVALLRPGYRSKFGTSDGQTSYQDDDYTAGNVEIVSDALASLRELNPGVRILLVGHSGGSAMTALIASRHPSAADAYLVAGCPCDVGRWREWRNESAGKSGRWSRSLSPQAEATKIMPGTNIRLVVGTDDENTLPKFSEQYVSTLKEHGVDAQLALARGATHVTVLRAPEFYASAREMASSLSALAGTAAALELAAPPAARSATAATQAVQPPRARRYLDNDALTGKFKGKTAQLKKLDDGIVRSFAFHDDGKYFVEFTNKNGKAKTVSGRWEIADGKLCVTADQNSSCFLFYEEGGALKAGPRDEDARWEVQAVQ